jgi:hypothetical protein
MGDHPWRVTIDAECQGKTPIDHQRVPSTAIDLGRRSCWSVNHKFRRPQYTTHTPCSGFGHQQRSYGDGIGSIRRSVKRIGVRGRREQAAVW